MTDLTLTTPVRLPSGEMATATLVLDVNILSAALVAVPPPPPPPIDPPPPPPPVEPPLTNPVINMRPLNMGMLVQFTAWQSDIERYQRSQRLLVLTGATGKVGIRGFNLATGGSFRALQSRTYTLLFDGVQVASITIPAGTKEAEFTVPLAGIATGEHLMDIGGLAPGETASPYHCYVYQGTVVDSPTMWVVRGTYDLTNSAVKSAMWAKVPRQFKPLILPLPPRVHTPMKNLRRASVHIRHLVPVREFDLYRPNIDRNGIISTADSQPYSYSPQLIQPKPSVASYDGPRGQGTIVMPTDIRPSRAVINGVQRKGLYVLEPRRLCLVDETGHVKTLYGYRHKDNRVPHWEDLDAPGSIDYALEIVGDFPPEMKGKETTRDAWGFDWNDLTLVTDPTAPPINGEPPHTTGPEAVIADSGNNRLVKLVFSPFDRSAPPKVSVLLDGIKDPWSIRIKDGIAYVSERQAHRICAYNASTGAFIRVVVQGAASGVVIDNQNRRPIGINIAVTRAAPCCAPEGLALLGDWLYFGSLAQQQIRRVHLVTGVLEVVVNSQVSSAKAQFFHIDVDERAILLSTWSEERHGFPYMYGHNGVELPSWMGGDEGGTGDMVPQVHYSSAYAFTPWGTIVGGGMAEGLIEASATGQPGDVAETPAITLGRTKFADRGYRMTHSAAMPLTGLPLPWGVDADIDAYLVFKGHQRPS